MSYCNQYYSRCLVLTFVLTWHTNPLNAFTTCIQHARSVQRRPSTLLYATVSKPSSSKSGGYVPLDNQREDDGNKNDDNDVRPSIAEKSHTTTNEQTGMASIVSSQTQHAAVGDDPSFIVANLHSSAHHQQRHNTNHIMHTVPQVVSDDESQGYIPSHLSPTTSLLLQHNNIHTVPSTHKKAEFGDHDQAHSSMNLIHENRYPPHVMKINTSPSVLQHIQVQSENDDPRSTQVHSNTQHNTMIQHYESAISSLDPSITTLSSSSSSSSTLQSNTISNSVTKTEGPAIGFETSCVLTEEQIVPIFKFQKKSNGKVKVLNLFSLYTILICVLTCPLWALSMNLVDMYSRSNPTWDPYHSIFDKTGKIWCKIFLSLTNSYPTISGDIDRLKEKLVNDTSSSTSSSSTSTSSSSCLFVANHASFLDIAVLCTVLDPVFKFIAKSDLKSFPFIGQQLTGGKHILIDRNDRRSQLRAFKEGVAWLQKGVPLMAFPEGTRSKDGRLIDFKGGMFSMAVKSKVPIVPISISNTHAVFPSNALMPVQMGAGKLHVHVHPPIDVDGKSEEELAKLVREALLSRLPYDQHPLEGGVQTLTDDDDDDT